MQRQRKLVHTACPGTVNGILSVPWREVRCASSEIGCDALHVQSAYRKRSRRLELARSRLDVPTTSYLMVVDIAKRMRLSKISWQSSCSRMGFGTGVSLAGAGEPKRWFLGRAKGSKLGVPIRLPGLKTASTASCRPKSLFGSQPLDLQTKPLPLSLCRAKGVSERGELLEPPRCLLGDSDLQAACNLTCSHLIFQTRDWVFPVLRQSWAGPTTDMETLTLHATPALTRPSERWSQGRRPELPRGKESNKDPD